jgi:hypothetical protein
VAVEAFKANCHNQNELCTIENTKKLFTRNLSTLEAYFLQAKIKSKNMTLPQLPKKRGPKVLNIPMDLIVQVMLLLMMFLVKHFVFCSKIILG